MPQSVRTVSEDEDTHTIEGLLSFSGPFAGRDSYGTYFSARTDWGLDLHPEGIPVLFNHGFDPDFGLHPIGKSDPTSSFRTDDDGTWVQLQLDKREKYYATRVRPLLDANGLGLSQGSAEHSVRIDQKSGEVLAWPLHELSLTPTESNPFNVVAARTAEYIHIVAERTEPKPSDEPPAVPDATRSSSTDAATAASIMASLLYLRAGEAGETDQVANIDAAINSLGSFLTQEMAEPDDGSGMGYMSGEPEEGPLRDAFRAGARNSKKDLTRIDAIEQHAAAIVGHTQALSGKSKADTNTDSNAPTDDQPDASRSAELVPVLHVTEPNVTLDAIRAQLLEKADQVGAATGRRLIE